MTKVLKAFAAAINPPPVVPAYDFPRTRAFCEQRLARAAGRTSAPFAIAACAAAPVSNARERADAPARVSPPSQPAIEISH